MRNISYSQSALERGVSAVLTVISLASLFAGGLAAVRLLYELLFPAAVWLRNPATAVLPAVLVVLAGALIGARRLKLRAVTALTPLLLNLAYLVRPEVNLTAGPFLFFASLWLSALLLGHYLGFLERLLVPFAFIAAFLVPVYLLTLGQTVGTADTFEFQVVIPRLGIVHPTGYPLYILLTRLFTFIPLNSVAWRVNVGTAVYAVGAACLLFQFLKSLTGQRVVAVLAAVLLGLSPTFWSQAVQAEVYTLHALLVAAVLVVMRRFTRWRLEDGPARPPAPQTTSPLDRDRLLPAFLLGLGLTNHLTAIILLPAILITRAAQYIGGGEERPLHHSLWSWLKQSFTNIRPLLITLAAFLLPLTLYLYLPLRWQAVNGEPMGFTRFVDWVVGGRFQGALNLTGWWADTARFSIVGRLLIADWPWLHITIAFVGLLVLARKCWPAALFLALTWLGFVYYALSYYVPDLSVFLIPAHLVTAALWGVGTAAVVKALARQKRFGGLLIYPLLSLLAFLIFQQAVTIWTQVDASGNDGRTQWGRAVLDQPLDPQGAILADSVHFPPLYYLQQAEGLRPDMDIILLPDEAAYRAELDGRLAAGQTVYLARFLPGLAGVYHLRSVGPLTEVSRRPLTELPETAELPAGSLSFGSIQLLGYDLQMTSPYDAAETSVTFYWQAAEQVEPVWQLYLRWSGEQYQGQALGRHPANNNYPTNAWRPGEIVADFHTLPKPMLNEPADLALQVALAPPFTPPDNLNWQTVTTAAWPAQSEIAAAGDVRSELRAQLGPLLIDAVSFPPQLRPEASLSVQLHGYGTDPASLRLELLPANAYEPIPAASDIAPFQREPAFTWSGELSADVPPGSYLLVAAYPGQPAVCSWPAATQAACVLGQVEVSGAPLPEGAVNFSDRIALLAVDLPDRTLQPGGQLAVNLTWLGLADMTENYTVFVQLLDEQDRIVGQVDSWPLQGTFPTSQWAVGERVEDPYLLQLSAELPPGQYRLQIGWYLLATLQRLLLLDETGTAVDDKIVVPLGEYPQ